MSFKSAKNRLASLLRPTYEHAVKDLMIYALATNVYSVLELYNPEAAKYYLNGFPSFESTEDWHFIGYIFGNISKYLFPINEDMSYELLFEDIEPRIQIEAQGPCWNWDMWDEALSNPEGYDPYDFFQQLIYHGWDEDSVPWETYDDLLGWNLPEPVSVGYTDWDKLQRILKRIGKEHWYSGIRLSHHDSDSIFISWNPSEESAWDRGLGVAIVSPTIENLIMLYEQYQIAKPEIEDYWKTSDDFRSDPATCYPLLVKILERCEISEEEFYEKYRSNNNAT